MVHCPVAVQAGPQKRIINFSIRQSGSISVTLVETALKRGEDGKQMQEYFYCLAVYSSLGRIIPLHLRIEREATTFQTASYINNTALSLTFARGLKLLNTSGLALITNI
jgi:hypothetical protein